MGVQSSAINELVDLAANAQAMWRADVSAPEPQFAPRQLAVRRRSMMSEARVAAIRVVRSIDYRRLTTQDRLCFIVGFAMIALAIGLALRGDRSPVSSAAAATPATTRSTLTVTPIEATLTVTPIEVAAGSDIEMPAIAVAEVRPQSKQISSRAKKARLTKTKKLKKRFRRMTSADEEW